MRSDKCGQLTSYMSRYGVTHPDFTAKSWHVFVVYIITTWLACALVCARNTWMPRINTIGIVCVLLGFFITVVVVAAMPGHGGRPPHASSSFVWSDWTADIGYPNGFVFVAGMLNGAYAVGTPDAVSHLAEEIPYPQKNVPLAIALQMGIGFFTGLCYVIAILYAINDYDALFNSPFPIAEIYHQATGSSAGTIGLLFLLLLCIYIGLVRLHFSHALVATNICSLACTLPPVVCYGLLHGTGPCHFLEHSAKSTGDWECLSTQPSCVLVS